MTTVAVTGAGGYVGGRLAPVLSAAGLVVRPLIHRPRLLTRGGIVVDLLGDPVGLATAFVGVDTVVHLAGANEVATASDPEGAICGTVLGSRRVARAAVTAGVRRLVYLSTVHVYGARMVEGSILDEETPAEPRGDYATARLASEHLMAAVAAEGVEVVVFRLSNSVGAPADASVDRWTLVANDLCRQAVETGRLTLRSPGAQWRDFVALGDVCATLCGCAKPGSLKPGTYNLASGEPVTVRQLAKIVQDAAESATGRRPPLVAPDLPNNLPRPHRVGVAKLAAEGWRASTPLSDAIAETLAFCLAGVDLGRRHDP